MSIRAPEDAVYGPSGSLDGLMQMKREVLNDVMMHLKALLASFKGRDPRLLGMLSKFPPPPEAIEGKVFLKWRYSTTKSKNLKRVLKSIIMEIINPTLDMYDPNMVVMENIFDPELSKKAKKIIPTRDVTALQAGDLNKGFEYVDAFESKDKKVKLEDTLESIGGLDSGSPIDE